MRTFVAIDLPENILKKIQELLERLKPASKNVRWSRPESIHITLKFIGEIPVEKVEEVKAQLESVQRRAPLKLRVRGAGFFPNERAPRVIWLGIEAGSEFSEGSESSESSAGSESSELAELAREIEDRLGGLGIPKENRRFSAHLTLGRLRADDKLLAVREILRRQEPLELGAFTAEEFVLYESQLSPGGSIYRKLARFPLLAPSA